MKFNIVVVCLVVLMSSIAFASKLYKWVDKDGVIHVPNDPETIPHKYRISIEELNSKSANGAFIEKIEKGSKKAFDELSRFVKEAIGKKEVPVAVLLTIGLISLVYVLRSYLKLKKQRERKRWLRALELSNIDDMDRIEFEDYVSRLLAHQGFKVEVAGGSVDFGVYVIAQKNDLKYAVQLKRQTGLVSRLVVSDAERDKHRYGCSRAMLVTNSYFSKDAIELAKSEGCELVDRDTLAKWILGFQTHGGNVN